MISKDDNAVLISLITKKMYIEQLWRLTYILCYLQNVFNSHSIQWKKYFNKMILLSPLHCETQATWENLFFTVLTTKLRMFRGYISVIGASKEAKTQVISVCTLLSDFPN